MATRGRKPIPRSLRLFEGDKRKQRKTAGRPPAPPAGVPQRPPDLSGEAAVEWDRIAPRLLKLNLLSELDRAALSVYCQSWADWLDACANLRKYNPVIVINQTVAASGKKSGGQMATSPYVALRDKAYRNMCSGLAQFGLSPADRERLTVDPKERATRLRKFVEG